MFLDYEHALDQVYARKVGVSFDEDKLVIFAPTTLENGFKLIKMGLALGVDLIVVDSVAAMVPKSEFEDKKIEDNARIGIVAQKFSQTLPKLNAWLAEGKGQRNEKTGKFTPFSTNPQGTAILLLNQIRSNISTGGWGGGGSSDNTPGGKALKFYTYVRLKFTRTGSEHVKKKDPFTGTVRYYDYGNKTRVKLVKSKVDGKQGFTTDIFIRFNYGIDDYYSLIEAAVSHKIVQKGGGGQYKFGDQTFKGRENLRKFLVGNDKVFGELRDKVLASVRAGDEDIQDEELAEDGVEIVSDVDLSDLDGEESGEEVEEFEDTEEETEEEESEE